MKRKQILESKPSNSYTEENVRTENELINQFGFGKFQVKMTFLLGIVQACDAMEIILLTLLNFILQCDWNLSLLQTASLITAVFVGMLLGSPSIGLVSDFYGRRPAIMLCSLLVTCFGFLTAASPSFNWFLFLRLISGVFIGGLLNSCSTMYCEFCPVAYRALFMCTMNAFWVFGVFFEIALGYLFVFDRSGLVNWRVLTALSALPILMCLPPLKMMPESPRYLLFMGRHDEALHIINEIGRQNGCDAFTGRLVAEKPQNTEQAAHTNTKNTNTSGVNICQQFCDLFHPRLVRTTVLCLYAWFVCGFVYYGSAIISSKITEIPHSCLQNASRHTHETAQFLETMNSRGICCNALNSDVLFSLFIATCGELSGQILLIVFSPILPRRAILALMALCNSAVLILFDLCGPIVYTRLVLFVNRALNGSIFNMTVIYTSEVFPTSVRSLSLGLTSAMARIGAIATPFFAEIGLKQNVFVTLLVYALLMLLAALGFCLMPIETKGRQLFQLASDMESTSRDENSQKEKM